MTGISRDPKWRRRSADASKAPEAVPPGESSPSLAPEPGVGPADAVARIDAATSIDADPAKTLIAIREDIGDCTRCKLHKQGRTQVVFGVGNPNADLMFVGEAPAATKTSRAFPLSGARVSC